MGHIRCARCEESYHEEESHRCDPSKVDERRIALREAKSAAKYLHDARRQQQQVLLDASDGPEGIRIYSSDEEGVSDGSGTFPATYVEIAVNGASARFGPFQMRSIHEKLTSQISRLPQIPIHQHDPFESFGASPGDV